MKIRRPGRLTGPEADIDLTQGPNRDRPPVPVRQIAPDIFCVGPWGRTHTAVYLVRSQASFVLVDAGWPGDGTRIANAAAALFGAECKAQAILLTHVHPDHEGDVLMLSRRWGCPVYASPPELPIAKRDFEAMKATAMPLDRWIILPIMAAMGARRRQQIFDQASLSAVAAPLTPGGTIPGLPGWECVATPGHTSGHVSFFRPSDRVLISGDALVTTRIDTIRGLLMNRDGLSGPPWYTTWNPELAQQSVLTLARLRPTVVAGGHGAPLTDPDTAQRVADFAGLVEPFTGTDTQSVGGRRDDPISVESADSIPGEGGLDGLVPTGMQQITIGATPAQVWPWLVQIGRGRAGFYTYTWIENALGADIHNLHRVDPDLQKLAVNDLIWLTPDPYLAKVPGQYWRVLSVVPNSRLVLIQEPPANPNRGIWTLSLRTDGPGRTRLRSHTWGEPPDTAAGRVNAGFWAAGNRLMVHGMLRGIKERAEEVAVPARTGGTKGLRLGHQRGPGPGH